MRLRRAPSWGPQSPVFGYSSARGLRVALEKKEAVTPASKGRVLIVDDEPGLLEIYGDLLEKAGYQVETAGDGRAALKRLLSGQFNLVLSDISMPDMDGLHLLRAVREHDLDVPIVLMTGDPRVDT